MFVDLGCPDAAAHLLKAKLVTRIDRIKRQRGLKQAEAAKLLGLSLSDVSRLLRGSLREYSVDRLLPRRRRWGVTWTSPFGNPLRSDRVGSALKHK